MGLLALLTGKSSDESSRSKTNDKPAPPSPFRGVEIITYDPDCCQAAKAISNQRFLEKDLPMLPLDGCDAVFCQCKYKRFDDRRTDMRRAADVGFDVAGQFRADDQRSPAAAGRRSTDRY